MMKNYLLTLFSLILLTACSPAAANSEPPSADLPVTEVPTPTELEPTAVPTLEPKPQPPAGAELGGSWTRPVDGMVMAFVPGGTFQMGSLEDEPDANPGEFPQHPVTVDAYWIDLLEVSNAQYTLCVAEGVCRASRYANSSAYNGGDYPAVGVSWQDAQDYCAWIGGRLPTEAEWEYAAAGPDGLRYPWGDEFDGNLLNFCDTNCAQSWADDQIDDGYTESAPVGTYPGGASWVGALDLAGNVWEWVWDWYSDFTPEMQTNPSGPESGGYKIIRGGCWANGMDGVRTAYRMQGSQEITPSIRHPNIGFRCVIPAASP
ncbi:formylglycine-generating enzyme family protein [Chloroflexota bacterium]